MRSFVREKQIDCGPLYREVDIFNYTTAQKNYSGKRKRSKKKRESEPKQKDLNDRNARRYLVQLGNLNFENDPQAMHVTDTYSSKYLPESIEEAEREVSNHLRRIKYLRKNSDCRH